MSWTSIFKRGDILTPNDRLELEAIDRSASDLRGVISTIDQEWTASTYRLDRLRELADQLGKNPKDEGLMMKLTTCACMPSSLQGGFQHREVAIGKLTEHLNRKLFPQRKILCRVFQRALDVAESELKRVEQKEKRSAQDDAVDFIPSGKVLALQSRILELRNFVHLYSENEQDPPQSVGDWREILKDWV